jgi:hypothetical protein
MADQERFAFFLIFAQAEIAAIGWIRVHHEPICHTWATDRNARQEFFGAAGLTKTLIAHQISKIVEWIRYLSVDGLESRRLGRAIWRKLLRKFAVFGICSHILFLRKWAAASWGLWRPFLRLRPTT